MAPRDEDVRPREVSSARGTVGSEERAQSHEGPAGGPHGDEHSDDSPDPAPPKSSAVRTEQEWGAGRGFPFRRRRRTDGGRSGRRAAGGASLSRRDVGSRGVSRRGSRAG